MARIVRRARLRASFDTAMAAARSTLSSLGLTIEKDDDGLLVSYCELDSVVRQNPEKKVSLYVEIEIHDLNEKMSGLRVACSVPTFRSREISVQVERMMALVWQILGENAELEEPRAVMVNLSKSKNQQSRPVYYIMIALLLFVCGGTAWAIAESQSLYLPSEREALQRTREVDNQAQSIRYNHSADYDQTVRLEPPNKQEHLVSLTFYGGDETACILGVTVAISGETQTLEAHFLMVIFGRVGRELHRELVDVDLSEVTPGSEYRLLFRVAGVSCIDVTEASIQDVGACSVDGTSRASCADIIVPAPSSDIRITKN